MEMHVALPFVAASLGSAYVHSERAQEAVPLLEEALQALSAMGVQGLRSAVLTFLGEAYLALGQLGDARSRADDALALARTHKERGWEAWALRLVGTVCMLEPSSAVEAAEAYRQALALATDLGMRPLVAHCHADLGKLSTVLSKGKEVRGHLGDAIKLYREMEMRSYFEEVEAALSEINA
jgi:tetratricopeptide (TPR) repeat protein